MKRLLAPLLMVLVVSSPTVAQTVVDSIFTGAETSWYSNPNNWSPREVPNNSATRTYNVTVPERVRVEIPVRVSNLSANAMLVEPPGGSVTVAGSATIGSLPPSPFGTGFSGLMLEQGGVFVVEGTLTNFDPATRTLKGGDFRVSSGSWPHTGISTLRFPGADIVNLETSLQLGGSAQIVDEHGTNGVRNLAQIRSSGAFSVSGRDFTTAGDFTNSGVLTIGSGTFRVNGSYRTFDPATRTLSGGALEISYGGRLQFPGADIVRNSVPLTLRDTGTIIDQNGSNALRNLAFNDSPGRFVPPDGFTTAGTFTNAGEVIIASASGPGGGRFKIAEGHAYVQTGGSTALSSGAVTGDMQISGGVLTATSSFAFGTARIIGNLTVDNALLSPTELYVTESVQLGPNATFRVVADHRDPFIDQQAALFADGPVALGGTISIEELDEFPTASDSSTLAVQSTNLTGTFSNAPNGTRVPTTNGRGSFLVTYQSGGVHLFGYQRNPPAAQLLNISTRARVGSGSKVTIGGFIVSGLFGNEPRRVAVRGIGPSLNKAGVGGALADPVIELHDSRGNVIATNDNWQQAQADDIRASGLAPDDEREATLIATLPRGAYTVVLRGSNDTEGIGLVEVYDLVGDFKSKLANISTRGFVDDENLLIGGYISGGEGPGDAELTVRAIGPGLESAGVSNFLPDPTVELRDRNGSLVAENDDHGSPTGNGATILPGLTPYHSQDAATGLSLPRGEYTVIVRAKPGESGIALVEVYDHNR